MYDWPQVRAETDALWSALRERFRAAGIPAPDVLDRDLGEFEAWLHPGLVLGQTCGLPFVQHLRGRVTMLGAPDYGVAGCPPGWYRSVIVVRADDPRGRLADFADARFALNGRRSQSGYGAMAHEVAKVAQGRFFATGLATGSHAASACAVAEGRADIAALDAVSWRLIRAHVPAAAELRVLAESDPTPGLPWIAGGDVDPGPRRQAAAAAVAALDGEVRAALGLFGFVPLEAADYAVIRDRLAAAEARIVLPG
jgi:ABC-type phosphate/phosphonate transport system substrate-binding protein